MSYALERIAGLERDLVVEQGFAPLEKILPMSQMAGSQFHACLAKLGQERLDVHAFLAWRGQDGPELSMRASSLRRALESAAGFFSGRVIATLFVVAESDEECRSAREALRSVEAGHFLEKVQFGTAAVAARLGQVVFEGRVRPQPGEDWFEEHFVSSGRHSDAELAQALAARDSEERRSRRFLAAARSGPWATHALIGLNIFAFLATFALAGKGASGAESHHLAMLRMGANEGSLVFGQGQYWRLVASLFLHADLIHLGMNMVALYSLGSLFERFAGPWRLLLAYFCAGLAGSLLSAWGNADTPAVGASGAILGLAGALLALHWRRPKGFPKLLAERIFASLLKPVALIFVLGVGLSLFNSRVLFDNWGHFGGLSGGFVLALTWPRLLKKGLDIRT